MALWLAGCAWSRKPVDTTSHNSIKSPAHGQNTTPAAHPHTVTPQHLPSLPNTSVHNTRPRVRNQTHACPNKKASTCHLQILQQSQVCAADHPRGTLPRGKLPALLSPLAYLLTPHHRNTSSRVPVTAAALLGDNSRQNGSSADASRITNR